MSLHFQLDGFRLIYVAIAVLMWSVSGIFSREYMAHYERKGRYYLFFWVTFFAIVGVFLSADFYTTFLFFEIMSFTSYVWVAFDEKKETLRAAETYLAVAVIGGMVMLMGLFLLYHLCGTLEFETLSEKAAELPKTQLYAAALLLLFGFGAKAGCFPLHIWLPKAHPVAPAPTSALLSGILTKAGVFGIVLVSCRLLGEDGPWGLLIACLGLITMFLGAFLALFSVNLKRTLACSSVSQIGFILTGVGMCCLLKAAGEDNGLAVRGAFLHMVNHSIFKLVLFLCAGAVYMNLHQLDLNEIRGFGRKKPLLRFCFLMGALGISGVPLWSGYVSKTLLHESLVEYREAEMILGTVGFWHAAEWIFLISGGMTVAYMLKLYVALFVDRHPTRQEEFDRGGCMNRASGTALTLAAVLIPALGMTAPWSMNRLADLGQGFFGYDHPAHPVSYFSFGNLKGGLISIGIGIFLYFVVIRGLLMNREEGAAVRYPNRWPQWLDLENLVYRPVLTAFLAVSAVFCRALDSLTDGLVLAARRTTHSQVRTAWMPGKVGAMLGSGNADPEERSRWARKRLELGRKLRWYRGRLLTTGRLVEESFSFGLMLFAIGLCLTLGYLLVVFFRG